MKLLGHSRAVFSYDEQAREEWNMKWLYMLLALFGGMMAGLQAPINGSLGKKIGSLEGAFTSFFVGLLCLTLMMLFFGDRKSVV